MLKKLIIVLASCILFFSCRKADKVGGNVINAVLTADISTLDPALSYDTVSATVVYQAYEPLFQYHYLKRPYTIEPLLAESMPTVSPDGKIFTIKIKKGIRYHDNPCFKGLERNVKAEDFITQLKRLAFAPTNSNGWWLFDGKIKGLNEFREQAGSSLEKFKSLPVSGLTTPDEHTLVIELIAPYPQMLNTLAMSFTSPIPMEAVEFYKNILNEQMIGTGPFFLKKFNQGLDVFMDKFPHYREDVYPSVGDRLSNDQGMLKSAGKKIPFLDSIHFQIIKEGQTQWLSFMARKIDFINIPKDNFAYAIDESGNLTKDLKQKNVVLQISPTLIYWWLSFNMTDPYLGKYKDLRLAIAHAVNFEKYIQLFTNNIGQRANSIYVPGIPGYDPTHKLNYEYNPEKAKELLAKAGFPEGKGLPEFNYDVRGSTTLSRQQAEFIKAELEKIGLKINVVLNTFPGFLKKSNEGKLQFWQDGWALDYPDAENILQLLTTKNHPPGPNATYYSNPAFDQAFEKLKTLHDGPEKFQIMKEMETLVHEDLPWVMEYYSRNYLLYHDYVKNFRSSDLIYNYFKYIKVEKN